jgi:hypothetical protein
VQLPGAENAIVAEEKIRGYLLSMSHLEGRSKARFFAAFGFSEVDWKVFAKALQQHAVQYEAVLSKRNAYGRFYHIDGPIGSPDGRNPLVRSVWVVEAESSLPRLITAHPINDE